MNTAFTEKELNENYLFLTQLSKNFPDSRIRNDRDR